MKDSQIVVVGHRVIIGERSHQFRELSARIQRLCWFLFVTALDTVDNVGVHVGNDKIFSDTIHNDNTNAYRRVDLTAQLAHSVNPHDAMERLAARVAAIPNVLAQPAPSVEILTFTQRGAVLAVRPFCHNDPGPWCSAG